MLVRAVRSLLRAPGPFELLVIDQSDSGETEAAIAPLQRDARLRYLRSAVRGKGAALNQGLHLARHALLVCTDDDCEADAGWAGSMATALGAAPEVAVLFCEVSAAPHDPGAGFVPVFGISRTRTVGTVGALWPRPGLGAGMAVRREDVLAIGGFDETLGPGSRFPSCDDWDIAVRAVLCGYQVRELKGLSILHHGFRTFAEGREHARRDWLAIGAVCAKPLRARRFSALPIAVKTFWHYAVWPPVSEALHLKKPRGLTRISAFLAGFAQGISTPVASRTLLFEPRK
jgi:GT2 family glycosyltransferase